MATTATVVRAAQTVARDYRVIHGKYIVEGKEPDGDSVRFVADDKSNFNVLQRAYRIKPSALDQSVQLRLEGIDATELHYGSAAQPLGVEARDTLLKWMGFTTIEYLANSTMVRAAQPKTIPGVIYSKAADLNGRPIAYVFLASAANLGADGNYASVDANLLQESLNFRMIAAGMAYYTVYTSTPVDHRRSLQQAAMAARKSSKGVWKIDRSSDFILVDQNSIGPKGECILPKLFRRCTDYLKAVNQGFRGNLTDWIISVSAQQGRNENDGVVLHDTTEVHLADLILQRNNHIVFQPDLLEITFVEK